MLLDLALIAIGIALLGLGGHLLVELATGLALRLSVSPAVTALTVVAMGTSMPEFFATVTAAIENRTTFAVANVVGSNILNVALILGLTALIAPIAISRSLFRLDYPFMLLASWVALLLFRDGSFDRLEGLSFLLGLGGYLTYTVWAARRQPPETTAPLASVVPEAPSLMLRLPLAALALGTVPAVAFLAGGAAVLVEGAAGLVTDLGASERVIGVIVLGAGTSLPELVTSVIAALRRRHEIAVYNIIGSNIANLLLILGAAALVRPLPVTDQIVAVDAWVMVAAAAVLFPMMIQQMELSRAEGGALVLGTVLYMGVLVAAG